MKKNLIIFFAVLAMVFYLGHSYVWAATGTDSLPGVDVTIQDVFNIIKNFASLLLEAAGAIAVIFVILAGLRFMAARGDPARYTLAKKNFWHVLIGLLVIWGVFAIIQTVGYIVGSLGSGQL